MANDLNKVQLIGRLGQDPDIKYGPSGDPVCNLSLATSKTWKDKNSGQKQEKTEWHRIVIWGKLAEIAGEYLRKGSQIYIEGELQTRKWQDNNGNDRYTTEIILNGFNGQMQMLGGKSDNQKDMSSPAPEGNNGYQQRPQQKAPQQPDQKGVDGSFNGFDDDIPF